MKDWIRLFPLLLILLFWSCALEPKNTAALTFSIPNAKASTTYNVAYRFFDEGDPLAAPYLSPSGSYTYRHMFLSWSPSNPFFPAGTFNSLTITTGQALTDPFAFAIEGILPFSSRKRLIVHFNDSAQSAYGEILAIGSTAGYFAFASSDAFTLAPGETKDVACPWTGSSSGYMGVNFINS